MLDNRDWRFDTTFEAEIADGVWLVGVFGLKSGVEPPVPIVQRSINRPDDIHEPADSRQDHGGG